MAPAVWPRIRRLVRGVSAKCRPVLTRYGAHLVIATSAYSQYYGAPVNRWSQTDCMNRVEHEVGAAHPDRLGGRSRPLRLPHLRTCRQSIDGVPMRPTASTIGGGPPRPSPRGCCRSSGSVRPPVRWPRSPPAGFCWTIARAVRGRTTARNRHPGHGHRLPQSRPAGRAAPGGIDFPLHIWTWPMARGDNG